MIYPKNLRAQIAIGAMDKKIKIRQETIDEENDLGEVTEVTVTDSDAWAYEVNRDQDEEVLVEKDTNIQIREFVIRYKAISYQDKLVIDSNEYDIINIDETMGRRRFLKIKCKRVV